MSFKTRALYDPTWSPGKAGLQTSCRSTCPAAHWCTSQDLNCREAQFRQFPCCSSFCSHSLCHHSHMGTTPRYACVSLETFQPNPSWQIRIQIERKQFCPEKKNILLQLEKSHENQRRIHVAVRSCHVRDSVTYQASSHGLLALVHRVNPTCWKHTWWKSRSIKLDWFNVAGEMFWWECIVLERMGVPCTITPL